MDDVLRRRLWRHIEALPEEQIYQALDYIEFLTSKYARHAVRPPGTGLQRFGERLQDKLRSRQVGMDAMRGTLEAMNVADRVVSGITDAGRSILREVEEGFREPEPPLPPPLSPRPRRSLEPPPPTVLEPQRPAVPKPDPASPGGGAEPPQNGETGLP